MDPLSISLYSIHAGQIRTTIGMASLAISIIGFAKFYKGMSKEKVTKQVMYALGGALLIVAIVYGYNISFSFIRFIEKAKQEHRVKGKSDESNRRHDSLLDSWKYDAYYLISLISIIALFGVPFIAFAFISSVQQKYRVIMTGK